MDSHTFLKCERTVLEIDRLIANASLGYPPPPYYELTYPIDSEYCMYWKRPEAHLFHFLHDAIHCGPMLNFWLNFCHFGDPWVVAVINWSIDRLGKMDPFPEKTEIIKNMKELKVPVAGYLWENNSRGLKEELSYSPDYRDFLNKYPDFKEFIL